MFAGMQTDMQRADRLAAPVSVIQVKEARRCSKWTCVIFPSQVRYKAAFVFRLDTPTFDLCHLDALDGTSRTSSSQESTKTTTNRDKEELTHKNRYYLNDFYLNHSEQGIYSFHNCN